MTAFPLVLLRRWCHNNTHLSALAPHDGRKTAGMKKLRHCHPMYCNLCLLASCALIPVVL